MGNVIGGDVLFSTIVSIWKVFWLYKSAFKCAYKGDFIRVLGIFDTKDVGVK